MFAPVTLLLRQLTDTDGHQAPPQNYSIIWLALLSDFRAFDWIKEYKYPTVMHDQMKGLLTKYENV